MLNYIYIILQNRLKGLVDGEGNPLILEVDRYVGQDMMGIDETQPMLQLPAAYIGFGSITKTNLGQDLEQWSVPLSVRIYSWMLESGDNRFVSEALRHDQRVQAVNKALSGWSAKLSQVPTLEALEGTADDFTIINTLSGLGQTPIEDSAHIELACTLLSYRFITYDLNLVPKYTDLLPDISIIVSVL